MIESSDQGSKHPRNCSDRISFYLRSALRIVFTRSGGLTINRAEIQMNLVCQKTTAFDVIYAQIPCMMPQPFDRDPAYPPLLLEKPSWLAPRHCPSSRLDVSFVGCRFGSMRAALCSHPEGGSWTRESRMGISVFGLTPSCV